jgi:hypothetical protein
MFSLRRSFLHPLGCKVCIRGAASMRLLLVEDDDVSMQLLRRTAVRPGSQIIERRDCYNFVSAH